jgi:hypothetical protein
MYSKRDRIALAKWHISYFNAPDGHYVRGAGDLFLSACLNSRWHSSCGKAEFLTAYGGDSVRTAEAQKYPT